MQISLYYQQGSSDKVYNIQMEPRDSGWCVDFQFGRRGAALTAGTKTQEPVSEAEARKIFDKLVAEKKGKGYTEGEGCTPYTGATDKQASGVVPQLLNPIEEEQIEALIANDDWCAQEKFDGRNRLLRVAPAAMRTVPGVCEVQGINKLGLVVGIPQPIHDTAMRFGPGLLAGEEIADCLHVFDLLELRGRDLRLLKYRERYLELANAFASMPSHHKQAFELVHTAWTTQDKRKMHADLRQANAEGMVFKNIQAPYMAGRPNSGGPQLKLKFYKTCSAIVSMVNAKRSVAVHVLSESGEVWPIGNVTIPANKPVPQVAAIVEIRYLYMTAYPSGSLFQSVYLGPRDDVGRAECTVKQLQYRRGEDD
jgi:bifunctional non-homologous end joining protein LigD